MEMSALSPRHLVAWVCVMCYVLCVMWLVVGAGALGRDNASDHRVQLARTSAGSKAAGPDCGLSFIVIRDFGSHFWLT